MSALNSRRLDAFTTMTGQSIIGVVGEVGASNGTWDAINLVRDKGDGLLSMTENAVFP